MRIGARGIRRRGVVLILFALSAIVIFGFMALAFDLGRLYIARTEAQSFCDAAALAAVLMLDGTTFARSINAVYGDYAGVETPTTGQWKRYNFQNVTFTDVEVRFSQDGVNYVEMGPGDDAAGYRFAEVRATAQVPVYFAHMITGQSQGTAAAVARAAQVLKITWEEGLVPFWITAHCTKVEGNPFGMPVCEPLDTADDCDPFEPGCTKLDEDSGLRVGSPYAILWQGNHMPSGYDKSGNPDQVFQDKEWCVGDRLSAASSMFDSEFNKALGKMITTKDKFPQYPGVDRSQTGSEGWGFWNVFKNPSTSLYRQLIWGSIGQTITITDATMANFKTEGGQRTTLRTALEERASSGTSKYACAPVIDPLTLKWLTVRAIEFIQGAYGPSNTWCAIYRDSALNDCSLGPAVNNDGVYEVRLVR